ncbi:MAG: hypothetical protein IT562_16600 [Alphaproteobacteria bacterium]|nr:hypothetical protein [Alphaproteobacteria bacterium]
MVSAWFLLRQRSVERLQGEERRAPTLAPVGMRPSSSAPNSRRRDQEALRPGRVAYRMQHRRRRELRLRAWVTGFALFSTAELLLGAVAFMLIRASDSAYAAWYEMSLLLLGAFVYAAGITLVAAQYFSHGRRRRNLHAAR